MNLLATLPPRVYAGIVDAFLIPPRCGVRACSAFAVAPRDVALCEDHTRLLLRVDDRLRKKVKGVEAPAVQCIAQCQDAEGIDCRCSCGGENHGVQWISAKTEELAMTEADVRRMAPQIRSWRRGFWFCVCRVCHWFEVPLHGLCAHCENVTA